MHDFSAWVKSEGKLPYVVRTITYRGSNSKEYLNGKLPANSLRYLSVLPYVTYEFIMDVPGLDKETGSLNGTYLPALGIMQYAEQLTVKPEAGLLEIPVIGHKPLILVTERVLARLDSWVSDPTPDILTEKYWS